MCRAYGWHGPREDAVATDLLRTTVAVVAALGSGAAFATATVLQQRAARTADVDVRPGLLLALARDRRWLAGIAVSGASFLLQALALTLAPIVLVQPLIVTDLLFALPLAAALAGLRLGPREWAGAVLVASGLALFLVASAPRVGADRPAGPALVLAALVVAGVVAAAVAVALPRRGLVRTSALAVAAGCCFGLMSALTKVVTTGLADQGAVVLLRWEPWALAVAALTGLTLAQSAFRAGPLAVSLPLIDVLEPGVAVAIAVTAFGEHLDGAPLAVAGQLVAALAVIGGVLLLDASPAVLRVQAELAARGDAPLHEPAAEARVPLVGG